MTTRTEIKQSPFAGHTPGPWEQCGQVGNDAECRIGITAKDSNGDNCIVCEVALDDRWEVGEAGEANAALIAAAPRLLAERDRLRAVVIDLLGDIPDMIDVSARGGEAEVECRHCGRQYCSDDSDPVPVDATECSDDCPGYIARAALASLTT